MLYTVAHSYYISNNINKLYLPEFDFTGSDKNNSFLFEFLIMDAEVLGIWVLDSSSTIIFPIGELM